MGKEEIILERRIEKRTKWILFLAVAILILIVGFYLEMYNNEFLSTGKAADDGGDDSGGDEAPGGSSSTSSSGAPGLPGGGGSSQNNPISVSSSSGGGPVQVNHPNPACGDGTAQSQEPYNEECDDGNHLQNDLCDTFAETPVPAGYCKFTRCGDGVRQQPSGFYNLDEECDDGNDINEDDCLNECLLPICGDGVVWQGHEECDDANRLEGDGCNSFCEIELGTVGSICGNNICESGETCSSCSQDCGQCSSSGTGGINQQPGGGPGVQTTSSSSGGGGGGGLRLQRATYVINEGQPFKAGQYAEIVVKKGDLVEFIIIEKHTIEIKDVTKTSASIEISPPLQQLTLNVGQIAQIPLPGGILAMRADAIGDDFKVYMAFVSVEEGQPLSSPELQQAFEEIISNETNKADVKKQVEIAAKLIMLIVLIAAIVGLFIVSRVKIRKELMKLAHIQRSKK